MSDIQDSNGQATADGKLTNVRLATMDSAGYPDDPYGVVEQGCLVWRGGELTYVGAEKDAPDTADLATKDGQGAWITPGLVDCHTHLVYGGNRADEFEAMRSGVTYAEISKAGGGINRTVRETREASESELYQSARVRLEALMSEGVTTVEVKSGYGLNLEAELKMLRVIRQLSETLPISVEATCLAAHTLPFDFNGSHNAYIDHVIDEILPKVASEGLASSVDVFCESIAFNTEQTTRLFKAAKKLGFNVKGHVEQLTQSHGTDVVAMHRGLSADHLEFTSEPQVQLMAEQGVTAVILPGAFYYLQETQRPPIEGFRKHRVPMAVATDLNPGSSPVASILMAANMASVLFGLSPAESLAGITRNGAQALGLEDKAGQLKAGLSADFVLWDCEHPRQLIHELNQHKPKAVWHQGKERIYE